MKTVKTVKAVILFVMAAVMMTSCDSCKDKKTESEAVLGNGVLVLSEGLLDANNASLTYYDLDSNVATPDIFKNLNNRGLGDVANDMKVYGNKLYIVVNNSSTLEVVDLGTGKSLKQLNIKDDQSVSRQPRRIAFYNGKAYLTCFDGSVLRIDTASLSIEASVTAGRNPDDLCIVNGLLYVANTGGMDYPNYDTTISVFDLATFSLQTTITVPKNPIRLAADNFGDLYVLCAGDYDQVPASLQRIALSTNTIAGSYDIAASGIVISGSTAYLYGMDYTTYTSFVKTFDVVSEAVVGDFITDGTTLQVPYGLGVNETTSEVFVTDARDYTTNGDVYCFTKEGKKKYQFEAGICPNTVLRTNK